MQVKNWLRLTLNSIIALVKIPVYKTCGLILRILLKFNQFELASTCFQGSRAKYLKLVVNISLDDLILNTESKNKILKTNQLLMDVIRRETPVSQTTEFQEMIVNVKKGFKPKGCMTESDVEQYFTQLIRTYWNMEKFGYLPQSKILVNSFAQVFNRHITSAWPLPHELNVKVGFNGKFYWSSQGLHRLAIAYFLKMSTVYVLITDCPKANLESLLRSYYNKS